MLPTIADVAASLDLEPCPERRAVLDDLAIGLLRLGIVRREIAQMAGLLCRLTLDASRDGGDDDRRDAAAA